MKLYLSTVFLFLSLLASYQSSSEKYQNLNIENKIAIQGCDPVAYFKDKSFEGKEEFSAKHNGPIYYFISEAHKNAFLENLSKYKPQYGGWCAHTMGISGEKISVSPKTFKIANGKLCLLYNTFSKNTLEEWNKDENQLKVQADKNWKSLIDN